MKLVATARPLADALAIAAALAAHDKRAKDLAALGAIQITADSRSKVSANVLQFAVEHAFPATMIEPGVLAISGARLTALVSGFPDTAEIEISTDGATARITHARSRFKLEAIPTGDIPRALTLDEETSRIVLPRADAVKLFAKPAFAIGDEASRYYLCGIFLHNIDDGLAAVCTDGTRLCRFVLPGYAGLSQERTFIVPAAAARIASRLLADKANDTVTLRRSRTLFALEGACFSFVSKLIDGNFPDYERIIPSPSKAAVTVNRNELARAVARFVAVTKQKEPIGLQWSDGSSALRLCLADCPDMGEDELAATAEGTGRIAVAANFLLEQLNELTSTHVHLDPNGAPAGPLIVTDPTDRHYLGLISPVRWPPNREIP